jgi:YfiH family protein
VFAFRETLDGDLDHPVVEVAFTDASLDVAEKPDTDLDRLAEELARLEEECGVRLFRMNQVHGADVVVVGDGVPAEPPEADALVTDRRGVALVARAADCVPVLLVDRQAGVVGAVHSGRPGLVAGAVPAAVLRMRALGAADLHAWVGPHVCGRCYEVPEELCEEVSRLVPEARSQTSWGTPALDIGAGVRAQLDALGVAHTSVDRCTREDAALWSYRRDGERAGRMAGLVWMRP